ncbi:hypothetical protein [Hymenobacter latericus]|uniref:hypothetical protein n=1 Tax=Hymenobacter sp. YIM 151858-1 TaxID=2987688 RepID=UPI00222712D0|nr:hypothetical protein [Hymenobacter sp. YIM 151858-1]UYZ60767.1 hypothetical protein OIS50_08180 [Hymenobacter sp. YIM 151858-1]
MITNTVPLASSTTTAAAPALYSAKAIRVFSALFSAVAGGLMMAHNFRQVGRPDAARKALWGSLAYTALVLLLATLLPENFPDGGSIGIVTGLSGGMALTNYFRRLVPDAANYPSKSVLKPLLICLLIFIPILLLVVLPALR